MNPFQNDGRLRVIRQATQEERDKSLHDIMSMNITQITMQVMINGMIDEYGNKLLRQIKDAGLLTQKKKGKNPYKWIYNIVSDAVTVFKHRSRVAMNDALMPCVSSKFPYYVDVFLKDCGDMSAVYQYGYKNMFKDLENEVQAALDDLFDGYPHKEVQISAAMLEMVANQGRGLIEEAMQYMDRMARGKRICITRQEHDTYESLQKKLRSFAVQSVGENKIDPVKAKVSRDASERYQIAVVSERGITVINESLDKQMLDYIRFCVACMVLDYKRSGCIPDEVAKHCEFVLDGISVKNLVREVKKASEIDEDDPWDMMDAMDGLRLPLIEKLIDKCLNMIM